MGPFLRNSIPFFIVKYFKNLSQQCVMIANQMVRFDARVVYIGAIYIHRV